jgi:hypothetical protein
MNPADRLLDLVETGRELMSRERAFLLRGELAPAARLAAEKRALLAALDEVIPRVRGTGPVRAALTRLIAEGRRNERLILSARQGLSQARRRVEAITATSRGAVAYDRDGRPITSRDDASRKSSRA